MSGAMEWALDYLLNSVWQIPVLAVCTWGLVKLTERAGVRLQARLWVGCLLLGVLLPAVPRLKMPEFSPRRTEVVGVKAARPAASRTIAGAADRIAGYTDGIALPMKTGWLGRLLLGMYGASLLLGGVRLLRELGKTRTVVLRSHPMELPRGIEAELLRLERSFDVGPVEVRGSAELHSPATVSWPLPMLLLPESFAMLQEEDAAAALGHELAHVKRRDFAGTLVLEMVLLVVFYHPVMRWVKRRVAESREMVCDEMAAAVTTGRAEYAWSLVNLAEGSMVEDREFLVGILGKGPLEIRVERLVDTRVLWSRRYRVLSAVACMAMLAGASVGVVLIAPKSFAQMVSSAGASEEKLEFDVASIRQNKSGAPPAGDKPGSNVPLGPGDVYRPSGGILRATNLPLLAYIEFAYRMTDYQEESLRASMPGWVVTDRFNIEARTENRSATKDQLRGMMRSLLAERFKLAVHYQTRQVPVFALVMARPGAMGPKLQSHPAGAAACSNYTPPARSPDGTQPSDQLQVVKGGFPTICGGILGLPASAQDRYSFGAANLPMGRIASSFSSWGNLGRPVVDRTGLNGKYDFVLDYTPEPRPAYATEDSGGPTFQEALKEQLGLKLEAQKGPVEFLVVDHVERPGEN